MSEQPISPFVPGARVAVRSGYGDDYIEAFVEKVYKTGNFTLKGRGAQQWRPSYRRDWSSQETQWEARQTGQHMWARAYLVIWDAATDAKISAAIAATKHRQRFRALQERFRRLQPDDIAPPALDQIEAALAKPESQP